MVGCMAYVAQGFSFAKSGETCLSGSEYSRWENNFQNRIRCESLTRNFLFLVRGTEIDEEFSTVILSEDSLEEVRCICVR